MELPPGFLKATKWYLVTNRPEITYDWIDSNSDLVAFTQEALTESHFYLDTEFHREKTYFPQLALVQIATSKRTVIIDPVSYTHLTLPTTPYV